MEGERIGKQVGTAQYGIRSASPATQLGLPATLTTVSRDGVPIRARS
jgi:hypothetical protein